MRQLRPHLPLVLTLLLAAACGPGELDGAAGSSGAGEVGTISQAVTARVCPGATTVPGIDVSVWQGAINWNAVAQSGQKFAIARLSYGAYSQDRTFAANWPAMKAAGLIRGAYQYFLPDQDAVAQANTAIALVGRLGPGDLPLMLDVEETSGQSPATITAKIHQWVDAVTAGTGRAPFIYTGAYFWDASVRSADFKTLPLHVAWYGTTCPGEPNAWAGHPWTFHQYASTGAVSGISGHVDMNVFNGTLRELQDFAHVNQAPRGFLDSATCAGLAGWAQDQDAPAAAVGTRLFVDGPWGANPTLTLTAGEHRADLCTSIGSCNHGFSTPVPLSLQDGKPHVVHAYAVDTSGGTHVELRSSPRTLTCTATLPEGVTRHVQSPASYSAWAFRALWNQVTVADPVLSAFPRGAPWPLSPRVIKGSGPAVYVVDGTTRRHVRSPAVMAAWHLATVETVTDAVLAGFAAGPDLPATPVLLQGTGAALFLVDAAPLPPPTPVVVPDAGVVEPPPAPEPLNAPPATDLGPEATAAPIEVHAAVGGCSVTSGRTDAGSLGLVLACLGLAARARRAARSATSRSGSSEAHE